MADALDLGSSTSVCGFKSHLPYQTGFKMKSPCHTGLSQPVDDRGINFTSGSESA